MLRLKPDLEVKDAFAKAAGLSRLNRGGGGPANEQARIREISIAAGSETNVVSRLREARRYPGSAPRRPDLLLAEVAHFCPVPLPNYQLRASQVLTEQAQEWRVSLQRLKASMGEMSVFSVPFARFLLNDENETHWVSKIESCVVDPSHFFKDWSGKSNETLYYFRRPLIVWPTTTAGSGEHLTVLPGGSQVKFRRPDLRHELLGEERPIVAPIVPPGPGGLFGRMRKSLRL